MQEGRRKKRPREREVGWASADGGPAEASPHCMALQTSNDLEAGQH